MFAFSGSRKLVGMKTSDHHALVTGGASGIGRAITGALLSAGNRVTIVGRDSARLTDAERRHPGLTFVSADLSTPEGRERVQSHVEEHAKDLSLLVNNAGAMRPADLRSGGSSSLEQELGINLVAPALLSVGLLPRLLSRPEAAIVNVSTALIYAPAGPMAAYSAAKAGLHAFTRALRWQLRDTNVRVFELVPPPVDTEMAKDMPGPKLQPDVVATSMMEGLAKDVPEIVVGAARAMRWVGRFAPDLLFRKVNESLGQVLP